MPYRLNQAGQIECDTADEAVALLGTRNGKPTATTTKAAPTVKRRGTNSKLRSAIEKSWAAARKLAKAEGISNSEARKRIAAEKKAKAKAK